MLISDEQILRSDYIAQRRRWEEERDREAHIFDYEDYEQADELPGLPQSWPMTPRLKAQPDDEQQVDEIEQMEEEELRALLELQEQEEAAMRDIPSSPTRYGSDDEDYDLSLIHI